jgi:hypothetical protein
MEWRRLDRILNRRAVAAGVLTVRAFIIRNEIEKASIALNLMSDSLTAAL